VSDRNSRYKLSVIIDAKDRATAPVKRVSMGIAGLTTRLKVGARAVADINNKFAAMRSRSVLALTAIKAATIGVIMSTASYGDRLAKTAKKLGLTVEELQEYRYAAQRAGLETSAFDVAFQRFVRRTAEARKLQGTAVKPLQELGITLKDNNGEWKTSQELFAEVADAMANTTDESIKLKNAFAFFDTEGVALVNMLNGGSKELKEMAKEAQSLGLMTDEAAAGSEEFQDRLLNLKTAVTGVVFSLVEDYFPSINKWMKTTTELTTANKELIKIRVAEWIGKISTAAKVLIGIITISYLTSFIQKIVWLSTTLKGLALAHPVLTLIAAAIGTIAYAAHLVYREWDTVSHFLITLWDKIAHAVAVAAENILNAITAPIRAMLDLIDLLPGAQKLFRTAFGVDSRVLARKMRADFSSGGMPFREKWSTSEDSGNWFIGGGQKESDVGPLSGSYVELKVEFDNAPKGMRLKEPKQTGDANVDINAGLNFAMG